MKSVRSLLRTVLLGVLLVSACRIAFAEESKEYTRYITYPTPIYGADPAQNAQIKRGEYLAKVADCAACHTGLEEQSQTFAGGLGIKTPFGTFYSPNITPDKATGIGAWSDDDFVRAVQTGMAPGWRHLFPVFPYVYYTKMKRQDVLDIKAYLFSLPPVHAAKKKNAVPFPFNVRFLQLGWRILFFYPHHKGEYRDDPQHDAEWNRGAYLVQGAGHCGMCHTPLNMLGAAKDKYFLRGSFIDGYYAADITGDGLARASLEDIMQVFASGKHLSGSGFVQGPMQEVEHNSLRYLSHTDMHAIAVYLKSVHSAQQKTTVSTLPAGDVRAIEKLYESKCALCHASGAAGAPKLDDKAAWQPRILQGLSTLQQHALQGINSMPAKGACVSCTDEQINALVAYMVARVSATEGDAAQHQAAPPRTTSLARGQQVYRAQCASCHDAGANHAPRLGDQPAWATLLAAGMPALFTRTLTQHTAAYKDCSDGDVIAAVKYMAQQSTTTADYHLW